MANVSIDFTYQDELDFFRQKATNQRVNSYNVDGKFHEEVTNETARSNFNLYCELRCTLEFRRNGGLDISDTEAKAIILSLYPPEFYLKSQVIDNVEYFLLVTGEVLTKQECLAKYNNFMTPEEKNRFLFLSFVYKQLFVCYSCFRMW